MRISKPQLVNVIGSGYAGIECALFLAGHGIKVHLFDDEKTYQFDELSQKFECNSTKKRKPPLNPRKLNLARLMTVIKFLTI